MREREGGEGGRIGGVCWHYSIIIDIIGIYV